MTDILQVYNTVLIYTKIGHVILVAIIGTTILVPYILSQIIATHLKTEYQ